MLTGTLDDFTLQDVLRLIGGARRTGALEVTRDGVGGSLFFRGGAVSSAAPGYTRRTAAGSPNRAIEDLTFDLMRRERGEFTWSPGAATPAGTEASLDVEDLLRDVSRRLEELAEIQTLVPSEKAVLTMAPQPPEGAVQINITPAEWRVLVLVDGGRTVAEIAESAQLDELDAMKLLYGLAAAGLVTARDVAPAEPVSDALPEDTFVPMAVAPAPRPAPEDAPAAEDPDPFLAELATEPVAAFGAIPPAPAEAHEAPAVDRSTAARELAGLFDDVDPMQAFGGMALAGPPGPPQTPRRVEDDDQVTRGLISRLIDGVKGL